MNLFETPFLSSPSRSPRLKDLPAPSNEQVDLLHFLLKEKGHAVVNAVAGSGKTTTLRMLAAYAKRAGLEKMVYLAFNRVLAESIAEKLPATSRVTTIHAFAFHAIKIHFKQFDFPAQIDDRKYAKILRRLRDTACDTQEALFALEDVGVKERGGGDSPSLRKKIYRVLESKILDLWHFARITLTPLEPGSLVALRGLYNLDLSPSEVRRFVPILHALASEGSRSLRQVLDFDDMLYQVARGNVEVPFRYDLVLVDEAQDLSNAQRAIVLKAVSPQGRVVAVGDPRQAIYHFAGANASAFSALVTDLGAKEFPLSVCYRCPPNHVALVKSIVPQIQAVPGRAAGEVCGLDPLRLPEKVQAGDLIVCRMVAPLVSVLFSLLRRGVQARIRGRDIGAGLCSVVALLGERVEDEGRTWAEGREGALRAWFWGEEDALRKELDLGEEDSHPRLTALRDKTDTLRAFFSATPNKTALELETRIAEIFADEEAAVWLSSVHRAKGLEADRVFVLYPGLLPLETVRGEEQERQEWNLRYVALTRAKKDLFLVGTVPPR